MKLTAERMTQIAQDSLWHDLGVLPSQNIPYKGRMDKLFIRPFELPELKLLSRAAELDEVQHLIRAVDNCISHDVFDITIGDFYYILLWLRINSMPKAPYHIEWDCKAPYFVHKETHQPLLYSQVPWPAKEIVEKEYDVSECKTNNTSLVHMTDLDIICLEEDFVLPDGFDFPRVRIMEDIAKGLDDPDMVFLVPALQWIAGDTWAEKIKAAETDPSLIGLGLDINRRVDHGISETATFFCNRCRIKHKTKIKLNALTFFR